jgi:hypothetical protein
VLLCCWMPSPSTHTYCTNMVCIGQCQQQRQLLTALNDSRQRCLQICCRCGCPGPCACAAWTHAASQPISLLHVGHVCLSQGSSRSGQALQQQQQQAGLGWAGLGWAGLGWAGLGSRSSSDRRGMHLLSLGLYEAALKERLRYMGLRYIFNLTVCS